MRTSEPEGHASDERRRDNVTVELSPAPSFVEAKLRRNASTAPAPLSHLLTANSAQERRSVVAGLLREVDHDWLTYGILDTAGERPRLISLWIDHAHTEWVRHYCDQAYFEVDPRLEDASASSLPFSWTLASMAKRVQSTAPEAVARRLVTDLGDFGIRRGVLLMLPGEGERRRHFMSLNATTAGPQTIEPEGLGRILTLGLCLNEYYTRYSSLPAIPAPAKATLTAVQREILGHVARGESDKRIAHLLSISSHAVDYHMRKLRQRFEAQNRVQLAQASQTLLD